MKNLHLLPASKQEYQVKEGGLFINDTRKYSWGKLVALRCERVTQYGHAWNCSGIRTNIKHLYITSDEEIKEGNWCYYLNRFGGGNIICQAYRHKDDKRMLFAHSSSNREIGEGITPLKDECKKIILTTDQDLIVDGVQPIDDEFLEWFVKNPNCEFVELDIETELDAYYRNGIGGARPIKIIIPQEEPKQERMYSEEDLKEAFDAGESFGSLPFSSISTSNRLSKKEWLEQFKKK